MLTFPGGEPGVLLGQVTGSLGRSVGYSSYSLGRGPSQSPRLMCALLTLMVLDFGGRVMKHVARGAPDSEKEAAADAVAHQAQVARS